MLKENGREGTEKMKKWMREGLICNVRMRKEAEKKIPLYLSLSLHLFGSLVDVLVFKLGQNFIPKVVIPDLVFKMIWKENLGEFGLKFGLFDSKESLCWFVWKNCCSTWQISIHSRSCVFQVHGRHLTVEWVTVRCMDRECHQSLRGRRGRERK